jgi:hypothetical protein
MILNDFLNSTNVCPPQESIFTLTLCDYIIELKMSNKTIVILFDGQLEKIYLVNITFLPNSVSVIDEFNTKIYYEEDVFLKKYHYYVNKYFDIPFQEKFIDAEKTIYNLQHCSSFLKIASKLRQVIYEYKLFQTPTEKEINKIITFIKTHYIKNNGI